MNFKDKLYYIAKVKEYLGAFAISFVVVFGLMMMLVLL